MTAPAKKLFVKTYGCQMNVYDSERMTAALAAEGYEATATPDDADLILLNTCHIREKAAEKVYSELGRLKRLKADRPALRIGVTGCVAQAEGAEIIARSPAVDLVVGPQAYHRLPALIARREAGERPVETDFPEEDKFDHLPQDRRARRAPAAFLTVQEGCDKFCAFCVVPYTRGAEVSRPAARIVAEAGALVERGVVESPSSARTSTPTATRMASLSPPSSAASRRSRGWRASATRPRIRPTWTTPSSPPMPVRPSSCPSCTCRCSRAATGC